MKTLVFSLFVLVALASCDTTGMSGGSGANNDEKDCNYSWYNHCTPHTSGPEYPQGMGSR